MTAILPDDIGKNAQMREDDMPADEAKAIDAVLPQEKREDIDYLMKQQLHKQARQNHQLRLVVVFLLLLFIAAWDGIAMWVLCPVLSPSACGGPSDIHPGIVVALIASATLVTCVLFGVVAKLLLPIKDGDKDAVAAVRMPADGAGGNV